MCNRNNILFFLFQFYLSSVCAKPQGQTFRGTFLLENIEAIG